MQRTSVRHLIVALALGVGVCLPPARAQDATADPIRVWVFSAATSVRDEVPVFLPPRHPVPRDPDPYYFEADRGRAAVTALVERLERKEYANVLMVVPARSQADLHLEAVATSRGSDMASRPRDDRILVVRLSIRHDSYTTDFIGERRGVLRTAAFDVAGQLKRWIESNYAILRRQADPMP